MKTKLFNLILRYTCLACIFLTLSCQADTLTEEEKKQQNEELSELLGNSIIQTILEGNEDAVFALDDEGKLLTVNDGIYDYTVSELSDTGFVLSHENGSSQKISLFDGEKVLKVIGYDMNGVLFFEKEFSEIGKLLVQKEFDLEEGLVFYYAYSYNENDLKEVAERRGGNGVLWSSTEFLYDNDNKILEINETKPNGESGSKTMYEYYPSRNIKKETSYFESGDIKLMNEYWENGNKQKYLSFYSSGQLRYESTFFENGNQKTWMLLLDNGFVRYKNEYYENGNMRKQIVNDINSGKFNTGWYSELELSDVGLVLMERVFILESETESKNELISYHTFKYNEKKELIKKTDYSPDGTSSVYYKYEYNVKGNITYSRRFLRGILYSYEVTDYNKEQEIISEKNYNEAGLYQGTCFAYSADRRTQKNENYDQGGKVGVLRNSRDYLYCSSGSTIRVEYRDANGTITKYFAFDENGNWKFFNADGTDYFS